MYPIHLPRVFLKYGNWRSSSNNCVSNHRIFCCENVVKQTMCLITCNAVVRVSHRMVNFSEFLHLNFHPDSDLVFLLRRFSLLTRWSFSKPWWDCDLLCWSRTNWRVQVWVPIKVAFSTIFVCARSALAPWKDITLKKNTKPSSSQFSHCSKRGLIILHVYFVFLGFFVLFCFVFLFFSGECYFRQWLPVSSRRTPSRKTHRGCVQRRPGTKGKRAITFSFTGFFFCHW